MDGRAEGRAAHGRAGGQADERRQVGGQAGVLDGIVTPVGITAPVAPENAKACVGRRQRNMAMEMCVLWWWLRVKNNDTSRFAALKWHLLRCVSWPG